MNDRRLARLKQLAAGVALVSSTVLAEDAKPAKKPEPVRLNSPAPKVPMYVNSPAEDEQTVDAGTPEATPVPTKPPVRINSVKRKP